MSNSLDGWRGLIATVVMLSTLGPLKAQPSDRTIGQFVHTSWSAKDGIPAGIRALAQTPDGFLWLGTTQGLYRFDGVSFELFEPESGPLLQFSNITALLALRNGDLWIGSRDDGVSRLREGKNVKYTSADGLPSGRVVGFVQDREGAIWVGTNGGLARFENDRWRRVGTDWGYPGLITSALFVDRRQTLWIVSEDTLFFLPPGSRTFRRTGARIQPTYQIAESPGGALWLAETGRSVHPFLFPPVPHALEPEIQVGSTAILFDDDGSLWITSLGDGMRRVPFPESLNGQKIARFSHAIESFTAADGLSGDYAMCILKDREGSIWVGTSNGLDRFRRGALVPVPLPGTVSVKVVIAGDDGGVWVGSPSAAPLMHIEGNVRREYKPEVIASGFRSPDGMIWLLGLFGSHPQEARLLRLDNGRRTVVTDAPPGFRTGMGLGVTGKDRAGGLWLAGAEQGIFVFGPNRQWRRFDVPPQLAGKDAMVTFADGSGRLWFGFMDNSIMETDGAHVRTFSARDGIYVGTVRAIATRGDNLWIGGEGGLAVSVGGRFRDVLPTDGGTFHGVNAILGDGRGNLFLSEHRGVVVIPATEILNALKDPSAPVSYRIFDVHDGLVGAIQQTGPYPGAAQSTDGRIWFSTSTGLVWIDPAKIPLNPLPPPVVIRSITANGSRYRTSAGLRLPPGTRNLTIDYTALSLAIPERVHFRYRLEGSDAQWIDAGTRRQAFYTNLSPRTYRFQVAAGNNDGVWNEGGAAWTFTVAPAFYETLWFHTMEALAALVLMWLLYRLRLRQMTARADLRYAVCLEERTRIARELHDTLLQSFQGSVFEFQAAQKLLSGRPEDARQTLEQAIDSAKAAIAEGRQAIQGLRLEAGDGEDFARLLRAVGNECPRAQSPNEGNIAFHVAVEGPPQPLAPLLQDELYRMSREILRNAFRHAGAKRIEVEIRYSARALRLRIRDDGVGIDPKVLSGGTRPGHWGLPGLRERAKLIGAEFDLWSQAAAGTEVEITVPASRAYRKIRAVRLFQRMTGFYAR